MQDVPEHERKGTWWQFGTESRPDEHRSSGRLRQESLTSNLGPVINLSAGGALIHTRRRLRGDIRITLVSPQESLELEATVIRATRRGLFSFDVGLHFKNVDEETRRQLSQLCMRNRVERIYHRDVA